jgi:nitroimidazol reductase NimA-like FMN-containing flavoprotein (pyridoxamine 5'-phosphate oxidase superfamily)
MTQSTQNPQNTPEPAAQGPSVDEITSAIGRRSVCTLATSSSRNRPQVATVIYAAVGTTLYVNTDRSSRKARNVAENPHVGVVIHVRRLPVGPPSEVQFQGTAEIVDMDDPHIVELVKAGKLKAVTSHGELDRPDGCFVRITPGRTMHTYGLGMSLWHLIRHPLDAAGRVELP